MQREKKTRDVLSVIKKKKKTYAKVTKIYFIFWGNVCCADKNKYFSPHTEENSNGSLLFISRKKEKIIYTFKKEKKRSYRINSNHNYACDVLRSFPRVKITSPEKYAFFADAMFAMNLAMMIGIG